MQHLDILRLITQIKTNSSWFYLHMKLKLAELSEAEDGRGLARDWWEKLKKGNVILISSSKIQLREIIFSRVI